MAFVGGSARMPMTQVEITMSCRDLADMDVMSKSDPFIVVSAGDPVHCTWAEVKRTEVIYDNLNPDFATKLVMNYSFEEQQLLRFEVYDTDSKSTELSTHDFLGRRDVSLGELVSRRTARLPLVEGPWARGALLIHAEELLASRQLATLRFSATDLDKKSWFWGTPSPYIEVFKCTEDGAWVLVSRTGVERHTRAPMWPLVTVPVALLCNGDHRRNIRATCWHWNSSGTPSLIGQTHFNLHQLSDGSETLDLINPEKQKKKGAQYVRSGRLSVNVKLEDAPTFLDYIQGGTEMACTIAIDFTASNGNPSSSDSLHYLGNMAGDGRLSNPYVTAIRAVGNIIQDYDSDKQFPVLGFGARVPPNGEVSHEFFVNLDPASPYCYGVEGVVTAYQRCLPVIQLYGPTNFAPVIDHVARFGRQFRDGSQYFILLIITDGVITDMPQTKLSIVEASALPISIIIVGVGGADFSAMEELDGDTARLQSGGRAAQRDIVQFVPLSKYLRQPGGAGGGGVQSLLAREVLAEVPTQFLSFMKTNNIKPGAPKITVADLPPDPQLHAM